MWQVKAIVITGKGAMFCGGAEITEFLGVLLLQKPWVEFPGPVCYVCSLFSLRKYYPVLYGDYDHKDI